MVHAIEIKAAAYHVDDSRNIALEFNPNTQAQPQPGLNEVLTLA